MPYDTTIKTTKEQKNRLKNIKDHHGLKDYYDVIDFLLESQDFHNFERMKEKNKVLSMEVNEKEKLLAEYRTRSLTVLNDNNVLKLENLKLTEQVKDMDKLRVEHENCLKEISELTENMEKMSSMDTTKLFKENMELKNVLNVWREKVNVWSDRCNQLIMENKDLKRRLNEVIELLIKRKKSRMKKQ